MPTKRRIPLRELLSITEYPKNMQHVLTLYAEGFSLADFLVQKGGKSRFLAFMQDAHSSGWDASLRRHYEEESVEALESKWSNWVVTGSPALRLPEGELIAAAKTPSVVRSQNPEIKPPAAQPKTDGIELASVTTGHSVAPRGETVVAPEAKRRAAPVGHVFNVSDSSQPVPVAVAGHVENVPHELRRPRGSHLSRPELRRPHEPASTAREGFSDDRSELSPSPFSPIETANDARPKSSRSRVNPEFVQPASLRLK